MIKKIGLYIVLTIILITISSFAISYSNKSTKIIDESTKYNIFKQELAKIPVKNINSAIVGKNLTVKFLKNTKNQKLKNKSYVDYEDFYYKVLQNLDFTYAGYKCDKGGCDDNPNSNEISKNVENDYLKIKKYLNKKGFDAYFEEGEFWQNENINFLYTNFSKYLSKDWQEYLKIKDTEYKAPYLNEGTYLAIEPDELRKRIIYTEKFVDKYPKFERKKELKNLVECDYQRKYFYNLLCGFEKGEKCDAGLIKSYENFLKYNKDSKYYKNVKRFDDVLKDNNYEFIWYNHGYEEIITDVRYKKMEEEFFKSCK